MKEKEKLHPFHVALLIFMIQTGVVMMSLPRLLAESFGYNGWLSLLIFAAIAMCNIFLISQVQRLGGGKSVYEILERSLPKFVLYPVYVFLIVVWSLLGCLVGKQYIVVFQMMAFPTTDPMFFKLLIDILAFLLVIKGIYSISKAATSFFWISIWMALLLFFFIRDFEWVRLTPFFFQGDTDLAKGVDIYSSFLGYELALFLIPHAGQGRKFIKAVYIGNAMTAFAYIVLSVISFGFFSFGQLMKLKYPLLDLLSYIRLPFVERIENLLFSFLLFTTLITIVMYIWTSVETTRRMLPKAKGNWIAAVILGSVFFVAWIPDVIYEIQAWITYIGYIETAIAFGLPLLLIIILLIGKGARQHG